FARLRRSFLMHPAMAAAAMLVMVVGVAGTVYVRQGDHFAAPEVASTGAAAPAGPEHVQAVQAADPAKQKNERSAPRDRDSYRVGVADDRAAGRFEQQDADPAAAPATPAPAPAPAKPAPRPEP